jgi:6-pyruvoyltetrahydropterin/6-carboxytetrahydropterin synthase
VPTYRLRVRSSFEAHHHLTAYKGKPEPGHDHVWQVEAAVVAARLDHEGMAFDFVEIKKVLDHLAARFHQRDINAVPPFDRVSPTAEHLAEWFFQEVGARLPTARIEEVTVWEGPNCAATYRP